jgi:hypothetical protein
MAVLSQQVFSSTERMLATRSVSFATKSSGLEGARVHAKPKRVALFNLIGGVDLNHRPLGYEPNRSPLSRCDSTGLTLPK